MRKKQQLNKPLEVKKVKVDDIEKYRISFGCGWWVLALIVLAIVLWLI